MLVVSLCDLGGKNAMFSGSLAMHLLQMCKKPKWKYQSWQKSKKQMTGRHSTPWAAGITLLTRHRFRLQNPLSDQLTEIKNSFSRVTWPRGRVKHYHSNERAHSNKNFYELKLESTQAGWKKSIKKCMCCSKEKSTVDVQLYCWCHSVGRPQGSVSRC